jgi:hypothetical protein
VLHLFYSRAGTLSPLFGSNDQRATFYASGWTLLRWALDHYAGTDEAAFLRALTLEPSLTGIANLAARTGRPRPRCWRTGGSRCTWTTRRG